MDELVETERQYVKQLEECISCFISEMQSSGPQLPDALKGKEKVVFGNIQAIYEFHRRYGRSTQTWLARLDYPVKFSLSLSLSLHSSTFLQLVEDAKDSVEGMGRCFLDQVRPLFCHVTIM